METTVGERLRQFRESKNLKQAAFGERADIKQTTLSAIEKGDSVPSYPILQKLLTAYPDLAPDWLLMGNGSMYKSGELTRMPKSASTETEKPEAVPENYGASVELAITRARIADRDETILEQAREIARLNRELGKPFNGLDAASPRPPVPAAPIGFRLSVSHRVGGKGAARPL